MLTDSNQQYLGDDHAGLIAMTRGEKGMERAAEANARALALARGGDSAAAIAAHLEAAELAPEWHVPWLHLGAAYKAARDWPNALRAYLRLLELEPNAHFGTYGNIGLAATAAGDWRCARWAWEAIGVRLSPGHGPPTGTFGFALIRFDWPDVTADLLGRRLDPVRARVPDLLGRVIEGRRADVVLHDFKSIDERAFGGKRYLVFRALAVLEREPHRRR